MERSNSKQPAVVVLTYVVVILTIQQIVLVGGWGSLEARARGPGDESNKQQLKDWELARLGVR